MHKNIFKPFIRFVKWHLDFFDTRKLWLETAKKYNVEIIKYDTKVDSFMEKIYSIWKGIGLLCAFSSYILFPVYLFLMLYVPSCPDIISQLLEWHLFLLWAYIVCVMEQRVSAEDDMKKYKDFL